MSRKGWIIIVVVIALSSMLLVVKKYLTRQEKIHEITMPLPGDIVLGNADAPESLIVYFNYNCTFCKGFMNEAYPIIKNKYLDTGQINLRLRLTCPLGDEVALKAYQTAICVNGIGQFDKIHKLFMHNSKVMYTTHFQGLVDDFIAINEELGECIVENNDFRAVKINNQALGELKTNGTPTFVFKNKVKSGYADFSTFEKKLLNN
jgi:protein-disulfide isomerase